MKNTKKWGIKLQATILFLLFMLTITSPMFNVLASAKDWTDSTTDDIIKGITLSYKLKDSPNSIPLEGNGPHNIPDITKVEKFNAKYTFLLTDYIYEDQENYGKTKRNVKGGDFYYIDLPEQVNITNPTTVKGPINDGDDHIADYECVKDVNGEYRRIKVTFTDFVTTTPEFTGEEDILTIDGELELDFTIDLESIGGEHGNQIKIKIDKETEIVLDVTVPPAPETVPKELVKSIVGSYSDADRKLVWNVKMEPKTANFEGYIFTDIIDKDNLILEKIEHGGRVLVEGEEADYTFNAETGEIKYVIPEGYNGENYQNIKIFTKVKSKVYEPHDTPTTIKNTANLESKDGTVNIKSNESTQKILPNWLYKEGTNLGGKQIEWKLNANITKQLIYNGIITDELQKDVEFLQDTLKLGGSKVDVYEIVNGVTPQLPTDNTKIYATYEKIDDPSKPNLLKIYLPRERTNAQSDTYNFTFTTDIIPVEPGNIIDGDPKYYNKAYMSADYVGDDGIEGTGGGKVSVDLEQVFEAVPYVTVIKENKPFTDLDRRNGTIVWTISAVSNVSEYGKSRIIDTLPAPINQDFDIDGIYWITSGGEVKLSETTEPSAVITDNILTITFNTTEKALHTVQKFTVRTKIKIDIYGDNLGNQKIFKNDVTAEILKKGEDVRLKHATDTHEVDHPNAVIKKDNVVYDGNTTQLSENPRADYKIVINGNRMPLSNVIVTDDLNEITTQFTPIGGSSANVADVKWEYVADSFSIKKIEGSVDSASIISNAVFSHVNGLITLSFGNVTIEDKYEITFTVELDAAKYSTLPEFRDNGYFEAVGNTAKIVGGNLKPTGVTSTTTSSPKIENLVLKKDGVHLVKDQQVEWTIKINQYGLPLDINQVIDVLPEGATLDPTTLRLYKNVLDENGKFANLDDDGKFLPLRGNPHKQAISLPVTDYSYALSTDPAHTGRYVLSVNLPEGENTAYILRFSTDVDEKKLGSVLKNHVYLVKSEQGGDIGDNVDVNVAHNAGGGSTRKSSITVEKHSKDTGELVGGAVYQLSWLRKDGVVVPVRQQTATSGKTTFFGLTKGEKYRVTELTPPTGYKNDDAPKDIEILANATTPPDKLVFKNTPIKSGKWEPKAVKKLVNKDLIRSFKFELLYNNDVVMTGLSRQSAVRSGIEEVAFTLAPDVLRSELFDFTNDHSFEDNEPAGTSKLIKTLHFVMREVDDKRGGYEYDVNSYNLFVKVYNVKGSKDLKVVIENSDKQDISDGKGNFLSDKIPTFNNKYTANGALNLGGVKTVKNHTFAAGEFSFELYEGTTLLQTVQNTIGAEIGENNWRGIFTFAEIKYGIGDVGEKNYKIVEKKPQNFTSNPHLGYTYDETIYHIKVVISDPNDDGKLLVVETVTKEEVGKAPVVVEDISFTNVYTTENKTIDLSAAKALSGRAIRDEQFTFILDMVNATGVFVEKIGEVKNVGNNVAFPQLSFKQADIGKTFYYHIYEKDEAVAGYTYDKTIFKLKITVYDNHNGTLGVLKTMTKIVTNSDDSKTEEDTEEISFNNIYTASGEITFDAIKKLNGRVLLSDQFSFKLEQLDGVDGEIVKEFDPVKNDENGLITFETLVYNQADAGKTFYYQIFEIDDNQKGYEYSKVKYSISVTVDDLDLGKLEVAYEITSHPEIEEMAFTNVYTTSGIPVNFSVSKMLEGRKLEDQQFSFVLNEVDENGEWIKEIQISKNDSDGLVIFEDIDYTQDNMGKTYYYTIHEVNGESQGYAFDKAIYDIKVEVIDNGDGTLRTQTTISKMVNGEPVVVEGMAFFNIYRASGSVSLEAKKTVTGDIKLSDKQFGFTLTKLIDGVESEVVQTKFNDVDGKIQFDEILFNQDEIGKHIFIVREINDKKDGFTYETSYYQFVVTVSDLGNGNLETQTQVIKVSADGKENEAEIAEFVNTYIKPEVDSDNASKTGDTSQVLMFAFIAMSALMIVGMTIRRRKAVKKI